VIDSGRFRAVGLRSVSACGLLAVSNRKPVISPWKSTAALLEISKTGKCHSYSSTDSRHYLRPGPILLARQASATATLPRIPAISDQGQFSWLGKPRVTNPDHPAENADERKFACAAQLQFYLASGQQCCLCSSQGATRPDIPYSVMGIARWPPLSKQTAFDYTKSGSMKP